MLNMHVRKRQQHDLVIRLKIKKVCILNFAKNIDRSRNHSKIDQNPVTGNFVSILLLPWSSRVVPRCQNGLPRCARRAKVPQNIKMETPNPPNGNWRSQKGPAAEGVAFKIIICCGSHQQSSLICTRFSDFFPL